MSSLRKISNQELRVLKVLVSRAKNLILESNWQDHLLVESMDDGGMGSLKLVPSNASPYRKFGGAVSNLEFDDADGVKVLVALNIDQNGHLYEIDIWKTDHSPLIRIPAKIK
jgi:hypothetical protein